MILTCMHDICALPEHTCSCHRLRNASCQRQQSLGAYKHDDTRLEYCRDAQVQALLVQ